MGYALFPFLKRHDVRLLQGQLGKVADIHSVPYNLFVQQSHLQERELGRQHLEQQLWLQGRDAFQLFQHFADDVAVVEGKFRQFAYLVPGGIVTRKCAVGTVVDTYQRQVGDRYDTADFLLDGILQSEHVLGVLDTVGRAERTELADIVVAGAGQLVNNIVGSIIRIFVCMKQTAWKLQVVVLFAWVFVALSRKQNLERFAIETKYDTVDRNVGIETDVLVCVVFLHNYK